MSTETTPSKKSILTDAMERAKAIKDAKKQGEDIRTPEEIAAKRALKKFGLVFAGAVAATVTAIVVIDRFGNEKTASEDEVPSED